MKIILVAENASIDFGGEAALPCHYFRVLSKRQIDVSLVVHQRSKPFLDKAFGADNENIHYVPDTRLHRCIFKCYALLPNRLTSIVCGFALSLLTQFYQKRIVRRMISGSSVKNKKYIAHSSSLVVHQVCPVSPKEPSILSGLGVPVVFGPLNGGMTYPASFSAYESRLTYWSNKMGRLLSVIANTVFRGKREADIIMVANVRTQKALPENLQGDVRLVVENGVDLSLWSAKFVLNDKASVSVGVADIPSFVYVGRLVHLKAVDVLLDAFFSALKQYGPMHLHIVGDGDQRSYLESMIADHSLAVGLVTFHGWVSQKEILPILLRSRALVLASLHECGGAVVLEAMASSIAVVCTRWGGPEDYVDDSCGILVDPISRDYLVAGFSDAMLRLAQDEDCAKAMGVSGRKKIEQEYDWEKKVDQVIDIYQEVINNKN